MTDQAVEITGRTRVEPLVPETWGGAVAGTARPPRAMTADFVRVLLFTGVVVAHSVNAINQGPDQVQPAGLIGSLLHLTRYGFVAVTLFVLVLSMRGKTMTPIQFWRRRFGLIVGPYLVWTLIYSITDHLVIADNPFPSVGVFFSDLWHSTITGTGKYQLYFLLISMQIYLVFPALAWVVKRTIGHPWMILGVGAAIQIGMFVMYQYLPRPSGHGWFLFYENAWKTLPMYALFMAIGLVAAHYLDQMQAWLAEHAVAVTIACGFATAFTVGAYLYQTEPRDVPLSATTPWNPTLLPWLVAGLVLLWLGAMTWDRMRQAGRPVGGDAVSAATLRAFGVFAVHPLILDALARFGFFDTLFEWFGYSAVLRSLVLITVTLVLSMVLVEVLLRTHFSKWLVARDRIPLRRPAAVSA